MKYLFYIWVYRFARVIIGGLFVWAGVTKLADPQSLETVMAAFGLIPSFALPAVSVLLPLLEVVAGIALVFDIRGGLEIITAMLAVFICVLLYGIYLGLDIDCGCYGPEDPEADFFSGLKGALYRDFGMLVFVMYMYTRRLWHSNQPS